VRAANLDPNDPQVRTAVFGQQVQDFLASPIGDYLIKRAEHRLALAIDELKTIDPTKVQAVMALQKEIGLLEGFEAWLGDAVQDGLTAIAALDAEEDADHG